MNAKDKKAFRALDRQRVQRIKRAIQFENVQMQEKQRRAKIGDRSRKKLFKKHVSESLIEQLSSLHEADFDSAIKFAKTHLIKANKLARERKKEQRTILKRIYKEGLYEYQHGNPVTTTCLGQASRIFVSNVDASPNVLFNPAPAAAAPRLFNNNVTFSANTTTTPLFPLFIDFGFGRIDTVHEFEYVVPHDGLLSFNALYAPVGSFSMTSPGACFGTNRSFLDIFSLISVNRLENGVFGPAISSSEQERFFSAESVSSCEAANRVGIFNFDNEAHSVSTPERFVVSAGDRIFCFCETVFQMFTQNGGVIQVNVSSPGFGLDVPLVLARLES